MADATPVCPPGFKRNPGHLPSDAVGKRVRVILRHGREARYDGGAMAPPGWAADGRGGCRWSLPSRPSPLDILFYRAL